MTNEKNNNLNPGAVPQSVTKEVHHEKDNPLKEEKRKKL